MTAVDFSRTLPHLARRIEAEHRAAEQAWGSAVQHAVRAGHLLKEAKAKLPHGGWLPWLAENFAATPQTATSYMRLASNAELTESALSIREALGLIAEARAPKPKPEPTPNTADTAPAGDEDHGDPEAEPVEGVPVLDPEPEQGEERSTGLDPAEGRAELPEPEPREVYARSVRALAEPVGAVSALMWPPPAGLFDQRELEELHAALSGYASALAGVEFGFGQRLVRAPQPQPEDDAWPGCGKRTHAGAPAWLGDDGWRCFQCHAPADESITWRDGIDPEPGWRERRFGGRRAA